MTDVLQNLRTVRNFLVSSDYATSAKVVAEASAEIVRLREALRTIADGAGEAQVVARQALVGEGRTETEREPATPAPRQTS